MKYLLLIILIAAVFSCKKNNTTTIVTATVVEASIFNANHYLVTIDNPDPGKQDFICKTEVLPPVQLQNCFSSAFITNLPAALKVKGKKIQFTKWKNLGPNPISSYSFIPRDVEVYDVKEAN